jgi:hypothetical protein
MTSRCLNETADEYALVVAILNSRQRVIRCRHNLQWVFQQRTSANLNKGHLAGLSYHTSWESLTARYSGVTGVIDDKLPSRTNHVAEMDHPIHE